jgi:hypothetical protein
MPNTTAGVRWSSTLNTVPSGLRITNSTIIVTSTAWIIAFEFYPTDVNLAAFNFSINSSIPFASDKSNSWMFPIVSGGEAFYDSRFPNFLFVTLQQVIQDFIQSIGGVDKSNLSPISRQVMDDSLSWVLKVGSGFLLRGGQPVAMAPCVVPNSRSYRGESFHSLSRIPPPSSHAVELVSVSLHTATLALVFEFDSPTTLLAVDTAKMEFFSRASTCSALLFGHEGPISVSSDNM